MPDYIYLDNNATTQPLPEVVEAMTGSLTDEYANPSSVHQFGQVVRHHVECAREQVARLIHAQPKEIVFTSGGTESINLAIRGALKANPRKRHLVTTAVEHSAVLRVAEGLEKEGCRVDYVGVDGEGRIDPEELEEKVSPETGLVSLIHVNNETGVISDIDSLASIASDAGALVHIDATQSVGKLPVDVTDWPAHFVSMAAHKFHGPKGVGALFVRRRTRLAPVLVGGSQERKLRGGTENVAGIAGMGVAAECAMEQSPSVAESVKKMRDRLETGLLACMPGARVNGAGADRIYNTTNISFEGLAAEAILIVLSEAGICVSSGAACSSGSLEPSHVLAAMGIEERFAHGAVRFSLSRFNTPEEIEAVVSKTPELLGRLIRLRSR